MMGDMLVLGTLGPLIVIEVSGRAYGRVIATVASLLIALLALIKVREAERSFSSLLLAFLPSPSFSHLPLVSPFFSHLLSPSLTFSHLPTCPVFGSLVSGTPMRIRYQNHARVRTAPILSQSTRRRESKPRLP